MKSKIEEVISYVFDSHLKFLKKKRIFDSYDKKFEKYHRNMISQEDLLNIKNLFDILDQDGSDSIDKHELKLALRNLGESITEEESDFFMKLLDGNTNPNEGE